MRGFVAAAVLALCIGTPAGAQDEAGFQAFLGQIRGQARAQATQTVVNGLPTLLLQLGVDSRNGTVPISIAVYDGGNGSAYHFAMLSPPANPNLVAIEALFRSFRLLSAEEAAQLRPRVIRTVRASPGDSVETLSARMAGTNPRELFLMLNGLDAGQPLRPGQPVKIVGYGEPR